MEIGPHHVDGPPGAGKEPLITPPIIVTAPTATKSSSNSGHFEEGKTTSMNTKTLSHSAEANLKISQPASKGDFRSIAAMLQRAAKQIEADGTVTQASVFRSIAPFVLFTYGLGVGVVAPRKSLISQKLGLGDIDEVFTDVPTIILTFLLGMLLALAILRIGIWVVCRFCRLLCAMDTEEVFRTGECVDSRGQRVGEAGLIIGGLFT